MIMALPYRQRAMVKKEFRHCPKVQPPPKKIIIIGQCPVSSCFAVMMASLTYITAGVPAPAPGVPVRKTPGPGLPPHHRGGNHGTDLLAAMGETGPLEPEIKKIYIKNMNRNSTN